MGLKTIVKVSEITNLSDARYCAGMGVDILGFTLNQNHPKFIELSKLNEISSWVCGVKIAGEFSGNNVDNMNYLADQEHLECIQVNDIIDLRLMEKFNKPVIQKIDLSNTDETEKILADYAPFTEYFLLERSSSDELEDILETIKKWCQTYPVLLGFGVKSSNVEDILENVKPKGIALKGGEEIAPGLKTFDELADILEALEVDD